MKRILSVFLIMVMVLSLCACRYEERRRNNNDSGDTSIHVPSKPTRPPKETTSKPTKPPKEITTKPTEDANGITENKKSKNWESNVLTKDPFKAFGINREKVRTITFLDSMDDVPADAWDMGAGASSRVKGWCEWRGGLADIYFAAEGGINGEECTNGMFSGMTELREVAFNGAFHTDYAESMREMFFECKQLEYVDIGSLNTQNVKNMYCMFSTCVSLKWLDLSGFDTSRVTNMGCMFSACHALEYVDVSTWDTRKVSNMENMFRWCDILQEPDLSGWDVGQVDVSSGFMNSGMRINGRPWEDFFR